MYERTSHPRELHFPDICVSRVVGYRSKQDADPFQRPDRSRRLIYDLVRRREHEQIPRLCCRKAQDHVTASTSVTPLKFCRLPREARFCGFHGNLPQPAVVYEIKLMILLTGSRRPISSRNCIHFTLSASEIICYCCSRICTSNAKGTLLKSVL